MRVLLVYPNVTGHESTHQGLMSISAYLKEHGYVTSLIDFTFGDSRSSLISKAVAFEPDLIGFTSTSGMFRAAVEFASTLKSSLPAPVIFGGPHATVVPEEVLREQSVDMVCINEGEEPIGDLLARLAAGEDPVDIPNLWVKRNGIVHKNPVRPLMADLDKLPFPDYELFEIERYLESRNGTFDIITGRGCPYPCTYCINHALQEIQGQKGKHYTRKHSVEYVMNLIASVREKYPVKFLAFEDDLFTMSKQWVVKFCNSYAVRFQSLPFSCNAHPGTVDRPTFDSLKYAGCANVHIGVEAGDEFIRKSVLRRNVSDGQIIRTFKMAHEAGLSTSSYNILGSPYETVDHIKKTVAINQQVKPDHIGVSIFCPYPGTQLYELCRKEGLIGPDFEIPPHHRSRIVLKCHPALQNKIKYYKKTFRFQVYRTYDLKKALAFLCFDWFYDFFIFVRSKIPVFARRRAHKVYHRLIKHV